MQQIHLPFNAYESRQRLDDIQKKLGGHIRSSDVSSNPRPINHATIHGPSDRVPPMRAMQQPTQPMQEEQQEGQLAQLEQPMQQPIQQPMQQTKNTYPSTNVYSNAMGRNMYYDEVGHNLLKDIGGGQDPMAVFSNFNTNAQNNNIFKNTNLNYVDDFWNYLYTNPNFNNHKQNIAQIIANNQQNQQRMEQEKLSALEENQREQLQRNMYNIVADATREDLSGIIKSDLPIAETNATHFPKLFDAFTDLRRTGILKEGKAYDPANNIMRHLYRGRIPNPSESAKFFKPLSHFSYFPSKGDAYGIPKEMQDYYAKHYGNSTFVPERLQELYRNSGRVNPASFLRDSKPLLSELNDKVNAIWQKMFAQSPTAQEWEMSSPMAEPSSSEFQKNPMEAIAALTENDFLQKALKLLSDNNALPKSLETIFQNRDLTPLLQDEEVLNFLGSVLQLSDSPKEMIDNAKNRLRKASLSSFNPDLIFTDTIERLLNVFNNMTAEDIEKLPNRQALMKFFNDRQQKQQEKVPSINDIYDKYIEKPKLNALREKIFENDTKSIADEYNTTNSNKLAFQNNTKSQLPKVNDDMPLPFAHEAFKGKTFGDIKNINSYVMDMFANGVNSTPIEEKKTVTAEQPIEKAIDVMDDVQEIDEDEESAAPNYFSNLANWAGEKLVNQWEQSKQQATQDIEKTQNIIQTLRDYTTLPYKTPGLSGVAERAQNKLTDMGNNALEGVKNFANSASNKIIDGVNAIANAPTALVDHVTNHVQTEYNKAANLANIVGSGAMGLWNIGSGLVSGLVNIFKDAMPELTTEQLQEVAEVVKDAVADFPTNVYNKGAENIQKEMNKVLAPLQWLRKYTTPQNQDVLQETADLLNNMRDGLNDAVINNPNLHAALNNFVETAQNLGGDAFAGGKFLLQNAPLVLDAVNYLASAVFDNLPELTEERKDYVKQKLEDAVNAIASGEKTVEDAVKAVYDSIADNVPELTGDAANAVYATVASFIEELDVAGNIEKLKNSTNDLKNELDNQYTEWAIKERELISEQREDQDTLFAIENDLKDFQKQLADKEMEDFYKNIFNALATGKDRRAITKIVINEVTKEADIKPNEVEILEKLVEPLVDVLADERFYNKIENARAEGEAEAKFLQGTKDEYEKQLADKDVEEIAQIITDEITKDTDLEPDEVEILKKEIIDDLTNNETQSEIAERSNEAKIEAKQDKKPAFADPVKLPNYLKNKQDELSKVNKPVTDTLFVTKGKLLPHIKTQQEKKIIARIANLDEKDAEFVVNKGKELGITSLVALISIANQAKVAGVFDKNIANELLQAMSSERNQLKRKQYEDFYNKIENARAEGEAEAKWLQDAKDSYEYYNGGQEVIKKTWAKKKSEAAFEQLIDEESIENKDISDDIAVPLTKEQINKKVAAIIAQKYKIPLNEVNVPKKITDELFAQSQQDANNWHKANLKNQVDNIQNGNGNLTKTYDTLLQNLMHNQDDVRQEALIEQERIINFLIEKSNNAANDLKKDLLKKIDNSSSAPEIGKHLKELEKLQNATIEEFLSPDELKFFQNTTGAAMQKTFRDALNNTIVDLKVRPQYQEGLADYIFDSMMKGGEDKEKFVKQAFEDIQDNPLWTANYNKTAVEKAMPRLVKDWGVGTMVLHLDPKEDKELIEKFKSQLDPKFVAAVEVLRQNQVRTPDEHLKLLKDLVEYGGNVLGSKALEILKKSGKEHPYKEMLDKYQVKYNELKKLDTDIAQSERDLEAQMKKIDNDKDEQIEGRKARQQVEQNKALEDLKNAEEKRIEPMKKEQEKTKNEMQKMEESTKIALQSEPFSSLVFNEDPEKRKAAITPGQERKVLSAITGLMRTTQWYPSLMTSEFPYEASINDKEKQIAIINYLNTVLGADDFEAINKKYHYYPDSSIMMHDTRMYNIGSPFPEYRNWVFKEPITTEFDHDKSHQTPYWKSRGYRLNRPWTATSPGRRVLDADYPKYKMKKQHPLPELGKTIPSGFDHLKAYYMYVDYVNGLTHDILNMLKQVGGLNLGGVFDKYIEDTTNKVRDIYEELEPYESKVKRVRDIYKASVTPTWAAPNTLKNLFEIRDEVYNKIDNANKEATKQMTEAVNNLSKIDADYKNFLAQKEKELKENPQYQSEIDEIAEKALKEKKQAAENTVKELFAKLAAQSVAGIQSNFAKDDFLMRAQENQIDKLGEIGGLTIKGKYKLDDGSIIALGNWKPSGIATQDFKFLHDAIRNLGNVNEMNDENLAKMLETFNLNDQYYKNRQQEYNAQRENLKRQHEEALRRYEEAMARAAEEDSGGFWSSIVNVVGAMVGFVPAALLVL